nr:MAG TPA: antirepressor [Caudoviricetes sp.]
MIVINESGLYSMIFGSKLESAIEFKHWITSDVLPTIRKTGGYVSNDELFINTYLPFADEQIKMLFSTTLQTIRSQNQIIESQKDEIEYKQEVINGLTDDIDIYKKKDVINRICRRRSGNYANRYKELYKCFRENFHIDLEARCEGFNKKQAKKKDQLSVIKYAEKFGYIDDLYSCCSKLYEAEIDEVLDQINLIHS